MIEHYTCIFLVLSAPLHYWANEPHLLLLGVTWKALFWSSRFVAPSPTPSEGYLEGLVLVVHICFTHAYSCWGLPGRPCSGRPHLFHPRLLLLGVTWKAMFRSSTALAVTQSATTCTCRPRDRRSIAVCSTATCVCAWSCFIHKQLSVLLIIVVYVLSNQTCISCFNLRRQISRMNIKSLLLNSRFFKTPTFKSVSMKLLHMICFRCCIQHTGISAFIYIYIG